MKQGTPGSGTEKGAVGTIYLVHFERPYQHARHYVGWSSQMERRHKDHANGNGSKLLAAVRAAGIPWVIARTWQGTRTEERRIHSARANCRKCPICCGRMTWDQALAEGPELS